MKRNKKLYKDLLKLHKDVEILKRSYVPNIDFLELRKRLIDLCLNNRTNYHTYSLDEGESAFNIRNLNEMLQHLNNKGNFYILLCGSECNHDISFMSLNLSDLNVDNFLHGLQVKRLYDIKIPDNEAYLIAMTSLNQEKINKNSVVKFIRQ